MSITSQKIQKVINSAFDYQRRLAQVGALEMIFSAAETGSPDPTLKQFDNAFNNLTDMEKEELLSLFWLGRDYLTSDGDPITYYNGLMRQAQNKGNIAISEYLLDKKAEVLRKSVMRGIELLKP